MKQTYEYMHVVTSMDSICVEDIGNCNLIAFNDEGELWLLSINTYLGNTYVLEMGGIDTNINDISTYFTYKKYCFQYNEKKINGIINKFINNPQRNIIQVEEIDDIQPYMEIFKNTI